MIVKIIGSAHVELNDRAGAGNRPGAFIVPVLLTPGTTIAKDADR